MSSVLSIKWVMGPQAWGLAWGLVALLLALTLAFLGWKLWNWWDGIARFLARFSLAGAFVFGGLVGSAVLNGGEKVGGTNGTDQASMPTNGMSGVSHPANGPSMVGAPLRLGEELEPTEPELRFTSIEPGDAGVTLGLEWTPNLPLPDGKIGIYGKLDLRDPIWSWLGVWMPPSGVTSGTVFVGDESLTGDPSVHPPMAFFKASTVADSDGDGLRDRDETGWVEHGAALPAFDFADAVDVADATSGGLDSGVRVVQLPFKAKLAGCFSDRVSICVDGVVGFLPMGFASARFWDMTTNRDMSDGYLYNEDVPVVAVYWDDLSLPLGTDGRIRTLSTVVDDENWFVVEYANVRLSAERWSAYTSRATIQVAVCEADPSTVYVRYLSLAGQFDGSSATLGAQGVEGTPNFPVAYNESGSIASGDVIAYHFGCGGSPQMRDTDGDGLDDGRELEEGTSAASADTDGDGLLDKWELDNGLDPTSADGQDGGCGDADGDGLSNADEQAHGTNPWLGDSDGDGLEDGEEAGGIVPVYGTGLPWLTFDSSSDLTASFSSDDFSLVSWRLPSELVIHGVSVENVVVDANGAVYFCRAGGVPPQGAWPCFSVEDVENDDVLVVVPYWSRFEIDTESTLPTRIRAGVATHGGVDYVLIECEHLHGAVGFDDESVLSYQLAVPTDHPERMFVRYRVDAGEEFTGENGVVQSLDFGQGPSHAYGLAESQGIATGLSLQFLFGFGSDPLRADGDDDGLSDVDELENGSDPNRVDTDSDGIPDGWELENGLDPLDPTDAALDPDGDGLDNLGEYLNETDPSGDDLDEDGVPDGYDTDGDGVDDGTEVENGSDPNDPLDLGIPPPLDECRLIDFGIAGDYAAWEMKIEGLGPYDWRTMRLSMAAPGWSVTSGMKLLHKGNTYRLTMCWLNSDGHDDECAPWYCWEAQIDGLPSEQTFDNYSNTRKPGVAEIVIGDGWIAENASGLLTSHVHECTREFDGSFGGGNVARGKEVLLYVLGDPKLVFDYDRDGKIDACDEAKEKDGNTVFRFWLNDDNDQSASGVNDSENDRPGSGPNHSNGYVDGCCDLLDFTPVRVVLSEVFPPDTPFSVKGAVKWRLRSSCVNALWSYLDAEDVGRFQREADLYEFGRTLDELSICADVDDLSEGALLPDMLVQEMYRTEQKGVAFLEGCRAGTDLVVEGVSADAPSVVVVSREANVCISGVEGMYWFYSLRGAESGRDFVLPQGYVPANLMDDMKERTIFFSHGFRVSASDARAWGSEVFKRFWQSGSNSRFVMFTWSGDYGWPDSALFYQQNAYQALGTGWALKALVEREQPDASKRVLMTQSLGNMVACEALKENLHVNQYFMFNAAVATECFDGSLQNADEMARNKYVPPQWRAYDARAWSANWYSWFAGNADDARGRMGWVDRFAAALNNADAVFNYYSTGDEVFHETPNPPWLFAGMSESGANYCWQKQETLKGMRLPAGTLSGGWGFHKWRIAGNDYEYSVADADGMIADGSITSNSVFNRGYTPMFSPNATEDEVFMALAKYVPAVSSPVGGNLVDENVIESHDLNEGNVYRNGWGRPTVNNQIPWLHSDMKDIAFFYVYKLYEQLIQKGCLK